MEVGPLSRMLIAYASGHPEVKSSSTSTLAKLNAPATALFSTLGRIAARATRSAVMAGQVSRVGGATRRQLAHGDLRVHNGEKWDPDTWPKLAQGFGFHEAPRGSLGHWVHIENKRITNYQVVVPSTWNAGPRDGQGPAWRLRSALLQDPDRRPRRPLEIMRTIHSFDPCLACAVHVGRAKGAAYTDDAGWLKGKSTQWRHSSIRRGEGLWPETRVHYRAGICVGVAGPGLAHWGFVIAAGNRALLYRILHAQSVYWCARRARFMMATDALHSRTIAGLSSLLRFCCGCTGFSWESAGRTGEL